MWLSVLKKWKATHIVIVHFITFEKNIFEIDICTYLIFNGLILLNIKLHSNFFSFT